MRVTTLPMCSRWMFSWYALRAARLPSSPTRTFGYHRVAILAVLSANAVSLVLIARIILAEVIVRFREPGQVHGGVMMGVASIAIVLNGLIAWSLQGPWAGDLNIRSAYLHMLGDALSACAVVVAGLLVLFTHQSIADPIVSVVIGLMILYSAWDVLKESVCVLLEAAPAGLDMYGVEQCIRAVPNVLAMRTICTSGRWGRARSPARVISLSPSRAFAMGSRCFAPWRGNSPSGFGLIILRFRSRWKGASRTICIAISERGKSMPADTASMCTDRDQSEKSQTPSSKAQKNPNSQEEIHKRELARSAVFVWFLEFGS